jgi:TetR/AcrR family transcriptional regulator, cholesterol catabolism regulator
MSEVTTRAVATRQRILDVAARQFRSRGYAGVSLRSIAAEAGMKAGSIYYHFSSREDIVKEVLDIGIELVYDAVVGVAEGVDDTPPADRLGVAMKRHMHAFLTFSDYTSANVRIFGQVPEAVRLANLPARRRYEKLWDTLLGQLRQGGVLREDLDLHSFRLFLLGAMNSTLEWFDPGRGDIEAIADRYARIALYGARGPSAHLP